MSKVKFKFLVTVLLLWLSHAADAQSQVHDREYLVVVLKQNHFGIVVDAYVNTVGGTMQFHKYDYTSNPKGERKTFYNVEDLIVYVDGYGYSLVNTLLLRFEEYIGKPDNSNTSWQFVQYIFKKTGSGYAPIQF